MSVPSLYNLAKRACIRNIASIDSVGDEPYELVRAVLLKIENPDQLHQIEQNSPQIIGFDAELWDAFIRRDIPGYDTKPHKPKNPANYWKVYRKLQRERQEELERAGDVVKARMESAQAEKHGNTIQKHELPKHVAPTRRQINVARAYGRVPPSSAPKNETFLEKARRKAMEQKMLRNNIPTHELGKMATKVLKAPASFIADKKYEAAAQYRPPPNPIRAPRRLINGSADNPKPLDSSTLAAREERLRALAAGRTLPTPTTSGTSTTATPSTQSRTTQSPAITTTTRHKSPTSDPKVREKQKTLLTSSNTAAGTKRSRDEPPPADSPDPKRQRPTPAVSSSSPSITQRQTHKATTISSSLKLQVAGPRSGEPTKPSTLSTGSTKPSASIPAPHNNHLSPAKPPGLIHRSPTPDSGVDRPKRQMKRPAASIFMPIKKAKLKDN